jgi:crotonobetainyl-CoA:carnitine CoA-transferase CaiB-like acyl-CoA transferase
MAGWPERAGVPAGPVNTLDKVFSDPQVLARGMRRSVPYPGAAGGQVELIGNPIRFSETPVAYRQPPPRMGEHTEEVLEELLGMGTEKLADLREIGCGLSAPAVQARRNPFGDTQSIKMVHISGTAQRGPS